MKQLLGILAVVLGLSAAFLVGRTVTADAQTQKAPARVVWEYKDGANMSEPQLNALGADGWELCTLVQYGKDYYYIFKRPK